MEDVARAELAFLAECQAAGPGAAALLDDAQIGRLIAHDPHRHAAAALREALNAGQPPAPANESVRMVLDLIGRLASQVQHPSVAAAELAGLRLELGTVMQAIRFGRPDGTGDLIRRRLDLQRRVDLGLGELLKGPRRSS